MYIFLGKLQSTHSVLSTALESWQIYQNDAIWSSHFQS